MEEDDVLIDGMMMEPPSAEQPDQAMEAPADEDHPMMMGLWDQEFNVK